MRTLSAKKLTAAIEKAQGVGIVEEPVTIDGCELVFRSLRQDEYEAIILETKDIADVEYLHAYQKAHVSRAIVEINGENLRGVQFVESEDEDPKKPGRTITTNVPLSDWLTRNVLNSWGREAIMAAFRKLSEIVEEADKRAKSGIVFRIPEETEDETYRRLLGELRALESEIPADLSVRILGEFGYQHKTTEEEVKAAVERLNQTVAPEPAEVEAPPEPVAPVPVSQPTPEDIMRARTPLNRVVESRPPVDRTLPSTQNELSSDFRRKSVDSNEPAARPSRTAQIADLEGGVGALALPPTEAVPPPLRSSTEVAVLERKGDALDPRAAAGIIERPPTGGINPRYKPPSRA